jgi:two-component system chemotaxis sensor kinase CheA
VDLRAQREFLVDIEELVEQLFAGTEELRQPGAQGPFRRELLTRIFRYVHSIKGVAATAGFNNVSELAHQTETLLESARSGRVTIEDAFVETLEEAANAISESLSAVAAGTDAVSPTALIKSIHELKSQDLAQETGLRLPDLPADIAASLNESEKRLVLEAMRENEKLYLLNADFEVAIFDKEFQELRTTLSQRGAFISSMPSAESSRPNRVGFRILFASDLELAELRKHVATFPQVTITGLTNAVGNVAGRAKDSLVAEGTGQTEQTRHTGPAGPIAPTSLSSSFVRIESEELDSLISASHELFGRTVAALDLISNTLAADARTELKNLDAQIRESLVSLEEQIIQLRMVSLDRVIQRAIRAGRVAARVSGKEIEFSTTGSQMRVDKVVCDAIADPLLHLVRNAVDQGIETPAERARVGKRPIGTVRIEASSAAGRVRFLVADDGRGIDPEVVSRTAAKQGLVEKGTLLSSEKSLRLIFRPGFSTASAVSSLSGRGVGLDIVEHAIERAGGAVRVRTQVGQGTEFEMRLPASLGVMRALVIVSDGHRYCVEAGQIVDRVALETHESSGSFRWHNTTLPLVNLSELLVQNPAAPKDQQQVLICKLTEDSDGPDDLKNFNAVKVEGVEETQEVLVRRLGRHAALWPGIWGAAELRDGTVALVLDLPLLLFQYQDQF